MNQFTDGGVTYLSCANKQQRKDGSSILEKLIPNIIEIMMDYYNNHRTHQGKMCCGRTPIETLENGKSTWAEKNLAQI
ncbi:hypothetical protein CGG93_23960 [Vibrio parahaemolyticus]|nr:hypothetical protein CGK30_17335 [Vibrio parahaemolyticus]TOQ57565.1 hypothetical protein CGG93_23960 [Vibrio parahaemolyticus]